MIRAAFTSRFALPLAALALALGAPFAASTSSAAKAPPVPGGRIGTLKLGHYACELPGDAGGQIGERVTEYDFTVVNASSYLSGGTRGSYLATGTKIVMTSGPLKGLRFERVSMGYLQLTGNAARADHPAATATPSDYRGAMRCILDARK